MRKCIGSQDYIFRVSTAFSETSKLFMSMCFAMVVLDAFEDAKNDKCQSKIEKRCFWLSYCVNTNFLWQKLFR